MPDNANEGRPNSTILGAAGEHYVMCQLLRRNMIAALAPTGVPNADIVVTDKLGDRLSAVQVKVRRDIGTDGGWHMGQKHEVLTSPNLIYCFVDFGKLLTDMPKTWIVPSAVVAKAISDTHKDWLSTPGARGQQRNDSTFRRFMPAYGPLAEYRMGWLDQYSENWKILEAASKSAANLMRMFGPSGSPIAENLLGVSAYCRGAGRSSAVRAVAKMVSW